MSKPSEMARRALRRRQNPAIAPPIAPVYHPTLSPLYQSLSKKTAPAEAPPATSAKPPSIYPRKMTMPAPKPATRPAQAPPARHENAEPAPQMVHNAPLDWMNARRPGIYQELMRKHDAAARQHTRAAPRPNAPSTLPTSQSEGDGVQDGSN